MKKRRFYAMLAFLLAALVVAALSTAWSIERGLRVRAQAAVAAAGIPYYDLRVDGRDAVLAGFVGDEADAARLQAVVASVAGIRTVRNELTVERLAETATAASNPASVLSGPRLEPEIRVQRLGSLLVLTGRLPDDGTADALTAALQERLPRLRTRSAVRSDASVAPREWTRRIDLVVSALASVGEPARLAARGRVVQLSGQIADSQRRADLDDLLAAAPQVQWRLSLTRPHGAIGGAP